MAESECNVCVGKHDSAIHDASLRIRKWLRDSIDEKLRPVAPPTPPAAAADKNPKVEKPKQRPARTRAA
jgi:hypothetical protein